MIGKFIKIVSISRNFYQNFFFYLRLNFKLVLAEPLDNSKGSHVQTFLDQHGGPGLQHIGLTTPNASVTVQVMSDQGAQFRKPPPTYYELVSTYFYTTGQKFKKSSGKKLVKLNK